MPRVRVIVGNWKMHRTVTESELLAREILAGLPAYASAETAPQDLQVTVCPAFTALWAVAQVLHGTGFRLGAQDVYPARFGAYTGEVGTGLLQGWCQDVMIGHSERRLNLGETDALISRKVVAALAAGLRPIVAIGESASEHALGQCRDVVVRQVRDGLAGAALRPGSLVLAYEPVWAIGTGEPAHPQHASEIAAAMRAELASIAGEDVGASTPVLYGGSVNPDNAGEFFAAPDLDGALVGGASLDAQAFVGIISAAQRAWPAAAPAHS